MGKKFITNTAICLIGVAIVLGCAHAEAVSEEESTAAFEYREIYLPKSTSNTSLKELHLNDVNVDWGLWGHNIAQVLPKKHSESVYAKRNGLTIHDQYCFSSDALYQYVEEYIEDNYGHNHTNRFAIIPNDNSIVCLCAKCKEAGNTVNDASPAVMTMIKRLSERFPMHMFFTSYYNTTRSIPEERMPDNAGVLISAMDYPLSAINTPAEDKFKTLLQKWDTKTNKVYIWDYINNFDDYFTPFPIFTIMQRRLKIYKENGVEGIFLNGSGTDFSSMHKLKTMVLAALTADPDIDWRTLLKKKARELYPTSGERLAEFMLAQEDFVAQQGKPLSLYDGVAKALKTYLPKEEFESFYSEMKSLIAQADPEEKEALSDLNHALDFTQLEILRLTNNIDNYKPIADNLAKIKEDRINVYNESCWTVDSYLRDYRFMAEHAASVRDSNLLKGVELKALTALDEDYSDISILTDGLLGLSSNYHCGHLISSADPALRIEIPNVDGMSRIRVAMTRNLAYHIALPEKVRLTTMDGAKIGEAIPERLQGHPGQSFVDFIIPSGITGPYQLVVIRNPSVKTMAIDEIEGF